MDSSSDSMIHESMIKTGMLEFRTEGKGLYEISSEVHNWVSSQNSEDGLLNLFLQHTSASLLIQENADASARRDLEEFLNRLVPDGQSWHQHTIEGPDDTTAHMKAAITSTFLSIPVRDGKLALGTWQGIYVWEHRNVSHRRKVLLTLSS